MVTCVALVDALAILVLFINPDFLAHFPPRATLLGW